MSISSGRIAEFLSRAQNINEKAKVLETAKPVISTVRSNNNSPIYSKKPQLSPISQHSFTSTHDGTPVPVPRKFILSGSLPTKKAISVPPKDKPSKLPVTKEKTELPSGRNSICSELSQKKQEKTITKESLSEKDQEIAQKVKEIEIKGKKKLKKVVEIFKQEALKTDQKLMQLQQENKKLMDIVDCPQLPGIHDSIKTAKSVVEYLSSSEESNLKFTKELENLCNSFKRTKLLPSDLQKKLSNWFDCLQLQPSDYSDFLSNISKKIVSEQKRRLKTEEETWKMIEHEEALIRDLEQKISNAETLTRNTSCRIINEHDDFEDFELNRDQISVNLLKLVSKKTSVEKMFGN